MGKVVAIIQARIGSTRLPGKIGMMLAGRPMLAQEIMRVKEATTLDAAVIATTDKLEDNAVIELAKECGVHVFRGSENDVLDRFYKSAKDARADTVVRLTGDCPLMDSNVIDEVVEHFRSGEADYTITPDNYPEGLDVEVFTFVALERAWKNAKLHSEREHVTPYIRNHPELFTCDQWTSGKDDYSHMHWSVDTPADFDFVTKIYEQLYPTNSSFTKDDVLALLARQPALLEINKGGTGYEGVTKSMKEDEDLKNISHES
jgi:spore coat polysaccharide biosynthesis protein SpsF (cytidylyltransferase family)